MRTARKTQRGQTYSPETLYTFLSTVRVGIGDRRGDLQFRAFEERRGIKPTGAVGLQQRAAKCFLPLCPRLPHLLWL